MLHRIARHLSRLPVLLAVVGLALAISTTAMAQTFNAHGFHLSAFDGDVRDPLEVRRAGRIHGGGYFAGALFEFADQPLVFVATDAKGDLLADGQQVVLDDLFSLNVSAGGSPLDRVRLDLHLPLYLASTSLEQAQGAGIGDLRLTAMVGILQPGEDGGIGVAIVPFIDLPTGDAESWLGNDGVAGGAAAAVTAELGALTVSGDVGVQFNPAVELYNLTGSDSLDYGLAAGWLVTETIGATLEARLSSPFEASTESGTTMPGEALLSVRKATESGAHLLVGGGHAISHGAGAPRWRLFVGGGFGRVGPRGPKDLDMDGILDDVDQCIEEPETFNDYRDDDGCPDALATIRVTAIYEGDLMRGADVDLMGPNSSVVQLQGDQPIEAKAKPGETWLVNAIFGSCLEGGTTVIAEEGDNEVDVELAMARKAWISYMVHDSSGAPIPGATVRYTSVDAECIPDEDVRLDDDGTGSHEIGAGRHVMVVQAPEYAAFRQELEIAPAEDQVVDVTLKTSRTRLEARQIVILDKVYFETAKAIIMPESYELLDEVATVIITNPHIELIEISGHTDSQGNDEYNLELSDARANAVRDYLSEKGVDSGRLVAVGYGEGQPVDTNRTDAGRANNRRVEFNIIRQGATRKDGGER